ncbi:MAG: hypothetical protein J0H88_06500 [Sphingomonadales bacterium]|nr:hypothetical protein [Sphingomonadales bacterium]
MRAVKMSLVAFALLSAATPASAQTVNSAADIGSNFNSNYYASAGVLVPDREAQVQTILRRLDEVCNSKRSADQRRCARAWRIIDDAHAKLQARRAAEAATAAGVANP